MARKSTDQSALYFTFVKKIRRNVAYPPHDLKSWEGARGVQREWTNAARVDQIQCSIIYVQCSSQFTVIALILLGKSCAGAHFMIPLFQRALSARKKKGTITLTWAQEELLVSAKRPLQLPRGQATAGKKNRTESEMDRHCSGPNLRTFRFKLHRHGHFLRT